MSAFKEGDLVEVKFEGEVCEPADTDGDYAIQSDFGNFYLPARHLTKLHDPLPTKNGAVIRLSTTRRAITVLTLTPSGHWFGAGSNASFYPARVKQLADEFGFTVLYAGDDE